MVTVGFISYIVSKLKFFPFFFPTGKSKEKRFTELEA